jgi:hypothetical protein
VALAFTMLAVTISLSFGEANGGDPHDTGLRSQGSDLLVKALGGGGGAYIGWVGGTSCGGVKAMIVWSEEIELLRITLAARGPVCS